MKRGLLIIGLALSGITAVTLNAAIQNEIVNAISNNKDKRIEIKADELPVEVAKHLTENYKEAQISKSYKWVNEAGAIVGYEVVLNSGAGEITLKYGPKGELVKE
ncbi:MAG: hypothetical protein IBJ09_08405 [Bacteroidia bacterium]|nr:hypothetical protein [Bacteroidia bacterium]